MGEAPPLEELAARKRIVQARMELHRAEMALYCHQTFAPLHAMESRVHTIVSNRKLRWLAAAGMGILAFTKKGRFLRKIAGYAMPFVLSRAQKAAPSSRVLNVASKVIPLFVRR